MIPVERGWSAFLILIAAGWISTLLSIWVFRRIANRVALRAAVNRVIAHLFEFRLFTDEPLVILRAQRDLLIANAQMLKQALLPSLILIVPFALLFLALDAFFAHAPLRIGDRAVVTTSGKLPTIPPQIQVETPPVHVPRLHEVSWRIRPVGPARGDIVAGPGLHWIAPYSRLKITYPPAEIFHQHWLVWYLLGALLGSAAFYIARRTA